MLRILTFLLAFVTGLAAQMPQPVVVWMDDSRLNYTVNGQAMSFKDAVSKKVVKYSAASKDCGSRVVFYGNFTVDLVFIGTSITVNAPLWYRENPTASVWIDGTLRNQFNAHSPHPEDDPFNVTHACTVTSLTLGDLGGREHRISVRGNGNPLALQSLIYTPSNSTPAVDPDDTTTPPPKHSKSPLIYGIVGGVVGGIITLALLSICFRHYRRRLSVSPNRRDRPGILDDPETRYYGNDDAIPSATFPFPNVSDGGPAFHGSQSPHLTGTTRSDGVRSLHPTPPSLLRPTRTGTSPDTTSDSIRSSVQSHLETLQREGLPTIGLPAAIRVSSSQTEVDPVSCGTSMVGGVSVKRPFSVDGNALPSYDFRSDGRYTI
ncbi:hypothetical protein FRB94_013275 [Tulasnella sp. JGI-2019a]|nr:hypothetical protein FRB93_001981 [Tulasnella sp. JGI-2019a]KAG9008451.1 hypothetical protein FRB94_013275 [Tulasnella sp. JGI-2019a]